MNPHQPSLAAIPTALREVARAVRAIGSGRRADPESILIEKHQAADQLCLIARQMEGR